MLIIYIFVSSLVSEELNIIWLKSAFNSLSRDTNIIFLGTIEPEIWPSKGSRSGESGQTLLTRISESAWPKKKNSMSFFIGYNVCTKYEANLNRWCKFYLNFGWFDVEWPYYYIIIRMGFVTFVYINFAMLSYLA